MNLYDVLNKKWAPDIQAVRIYRDTSPVKGNYQVFIAYFTEDDENGYCARVNFICDRVDAVSKEVNLNDSEVQKEIQAYFKYNPDEITFIEMLIDNEWTDSWNGKTFLELWEEE